MASQTLKRPRETESFEPRVLIEDVTIERYHALDEAGEFKGRRVELVFGKVYEMSGMGPEHIVGIRLVGAELWRVFPTDHFIVDLNLPRKLEEQVSEPEPDAIVYEATDPRVAHFPSTQVRLVVEVSLSSLIFDRTVKQALYAESGHSEYWIVNLRQRTVEVRREPQNVDGDWRYTSLTIFREGDWVTPLARPDASIKVDDLLP